MKRHAVAIAVALCLSPAWLQAQTKVLIVNVASADVHLSPSIASAVVGHAPRKAALEVTRELGSWVKVPWPGAPDGAGYIHVSMGVVGPGSASVASPAAGTASTPGTGSNAGRSAAVAAPPAPVSPSFTPSAAATATSSAAPTPYLTPATHVFGLGAKVGGPTRGFGASARAWSRAHIGVQLGLSRYALDAADDTGEVVSLQFEPSVTYLLPDHVSDFVWMRPYVGSGLTLRHQTLNSVAVGAESISENKLGFQLFGGSELTFATLPQFALSVDVGYHRAGTSLAGVNFGGAGLSVSGHWYVK